MLETAVTTSTSRLAMNGEKDAGGKESREH
jgi:hypothetical protein